jgi:hypothetical protein
MKPLLQRETDAPVQDGLYVFDQASVKMFGMTPNEQAVARRLPREDFAMSSLLGPAGLPTTGCLWLIKADPKKIACGRFAFCACSKHRDCRRWMLPPRYSRFFPSQLKDGHAYGYPLAADISAEKHVYPGEREKRKKATWTREHLRFACHPMGLRHIALELYEVVRQHPASHAHQLRFVYRPFLYDAASDHNQPGTTCSVIVEPAWCAAMTLRCSSPRPQRTCGLAHSHAQNGARCSHGCAS